MGAIPVDGADEDDDQDPGIDIDNDEDDEGDDEEAAEARQTLRLLRSQIDQAAVLLEMTRAAAKAGVPAQAASEEPRADDEDDEDVHGTLEEGEWIDSDEEEDDDVGVHGSRAEIPRPEARPVPSDARGVPTAHRAGPASPTSHRAAPPTAVRGGVRDHAARLIREHVAPVLGRAKLDALVDAVESMDLSRGYEYIRRSVGRENEHLIPLIQRLAILCSSGLEA